MITGNVGSDKRAREEKESDETLLEEILEELKKIKLLLSIIASEEID